MQAVGSPRLAHDKRPYICPRCSLTFVKFEEFDVHMKGPCKPVSEKQAFCIVFKGSECTSAQKRVNFTVDDYYYGYVNGSSKYKKKVTTKKFSCNNCSKVLRNNLRFMSHVRHKIENEWKNNDNVNDFNICNHCYRHYTSPFHLQCHIETVHATVPASTTCQICELNFENEEVFLMHMKDRHTYNEMPYVCKICSYRSSFYKDITHHFRLSHENSSALLCPFCLAVHYTANSYLTHVIEHLQKSIRCSQCRLQFFNAKDRQVHVETDHRSVPNCPMKKSLPKHPNQYMIFVKVSHHPSSPTKTDSSKSYRSLPPKKPDPPQLTKPETPKRSKPDPPQVAKPGTPKNSNSKFSFKERPKSLLEEGWKYRSHLSADIPVEYRPYVRETKIFVVLSFEALQRASTSCIECGENLGVFISNYNKHFGREYKCRNCAFCTHCFKGMTRHIFEYHLKAKYNPKTDKTPNLEINDSAVSPKRQLNSPQSTSKNTNVQVSPLCQQTKKPQQSVHTLLSSINTPEQNAKIESIPTAKSKKSDNSAAESIPTPAITTTCNVSSTNNILKSTQNSSTTKKRKVTDINSILLMKEQEQEAERSSKQRRKQSKPQKLELDSATALSCLDITQDEKSISKQTRYPSPVLKPLSKILSEEKNLQSMLPPVLDNSIVIDCDELVVASVEKVSLPSTDSPIATFASHLGLNKKISMSQGGKVTSTTLKSFVSPRTAQTNFNQNVSNTITTTTTTNKRSLMATSSKRKPPGFHNSARKSLPTLEPPTTSAYASTFNSLPNLSSTSCSFLPFSTKVSIPTVGSLSFPSTSAYASTFNSLPASPSQSATKNMDLFPNRELQAILLESPSNLSFCDVTNSSFLVCWDPPLQSNITEYKLVFKGSGLPTTQRLPVEQTSVRLIGLRSNTLYSVQICSVYRSLRSVAIEGKIKTLGLRENKNKQKMKVDEIIVLDDDDCSISSESTKIADCSIVSARESSSSDKRKRKISHENNIGDESKTKKIDSSPENTEKPPAPASSNLASISNAELNTTIINKQNLPTSKTLPIAPKNNLPKKKMLTIYRQIKPKSSQSNKSNASSPGFKVVCSKPRSDQISSPTINSALKGSSCVKIITSKDQINFITKKDQVKLLNEVSTACKEQGSLQRGYIDINKVKEKADDQQFPSSNKESNAGIVGKKSTISEEQPPQDMNLDIKVFIQKKKIVNELQSFVQKKDFDLEIDNDEPTKCPVQQPPEAINVNTVDQENILGQELQSPNKQKEVSVLKIDEEDSCCKEQQYHNKKVVNIVNQEKTAGKELLSFNEKSDLKVVDIKPTICQEQKPPKEMDIVVNVVNQNKMIAQEMRSHNETDQYLKIVDEESLICQEQKSPCKEKTVNVNLVNQEKTTSQNQMPLHITNQEKIVGQEVQPPNNKENDLIVENCENELVICKEQQPHEEENLDTNVADQNKITCKKLQSNEEKDLTVNFLDEEATVSPKEQLISEDKTLEGNIVKKLTDEELQSVNNVKSLIKNKDVLPLDNEKDFDYKKVNEVKAVSSDVEFCDKKMRFDENSPKSENIEQQHLKNEKNFDGKKIHEEKVLSQDQQINDEKHLDVDAVAKEKVVSKKQEHRGKENNFHADTVDEEKDACKLEEFCDEEKDLNERDINVNSYKNSETEKSALNKSLTFASNAFADVKANNNSKKTINNEINASEQSFEVVVDIHCDRALNDGQETTAASALNGLGKSLVEYNRKPQQNNIEKVHLNNLSPRLRDSEETPVNNVVNLDSNKKITTDKLFSKAAGVSEANGFHPNIASISGNQSQKANIQNSEKLSPPSSPISTVRSSPIVGLEFTQSSHRKGKTSEEQVSLSIQDLDDILLFLDDE